MKWNDKVFEYQETGKCQVCLAGSVIAGTLNTDPSESVGPGDFAAGCDRTTTEKLFALNSIRGGYLWSALRSMGRIGRCDGKHSELPEEIDVVRYEEDPKLWRRQMNNIIKLLKRHGE